MIIKHFGCTAIHNEAQYKCLIHSFYLYIFSEILGLIYEANVRTKNGRTVVSMQNLEFINIDVSGGYDQISRQVWAQVCKFLSPPELACSTENFGEL